MDNDVCSFSVRRDIFTIKLNEHKKINAWQLAQDVRFAILDANKSARSINISLLLMAEVTLDTNEIYNWETFHNQSAIAFGFPEF